MHMGLVKGNQNYHLNSGHDYIFILIGLGLFFSSEVLVTQSCLILFSSIDCSPPGSSVHGILQARIGEWIPISYSMGSSRPRDQTRVFSIAGRFFTI